jgi:periplasmic divalent cation tolerance protein
MTPLVTLMTARDRDEARRIAHTLVDEGLAACCNIVGTVESIYRWKGAVEETEEVLVVIKTTAERFDALRERVTQIHSYEIPELIALAVVEGLPEYLRWIAESVGSREE